ncbi:hypothetical protein D3C80_1646040 [compost metagenome]
MKAFTPGRVAHFHQDRGQAPVAVMAEIEAHRVERQPPAPQLREQLYPAFGQVPRRLPDQQACSLGQRFALAGQGGQVVGLAPAQRRQAPASQPA